MKVGDINFLVPSKQRASLITGKEGSRRKLAEAGGNQGVARTMFSGSGPVPAGNSKINVLYQLIIVIRY
jgi:hypothetical protein